MKLWILSDLHLEVAPLDKPLTVPAADVCVVAGDVLNKGIIPSLRWLEVTIGSRMPVVFVAGNHEFYNSFFVESLDAASNVGGGVHFLENRCVILGDVIFCGATLWTDFDLFGEDWRQLAMLDAMHWMNDYRVINYRKTPFVDLQPVHTLRKHLESRSFLEKCLEDHPDKKIVFLTHHAPSMRSVETQYRDDLLTAAFASDLEALMGNRGPRLWVHGHVHHQVDYMLGSTRVVCNPRGYPGEPSYTKFDAGWVIQV